MYCIIIYNTSVVVQESNSKLDVVVTSEVPDKILYINPDCVLQLLIDYIKISIGIEDNVEFDMCDQFGVLKYVNDFDPQMNASSIFISKSTYYIVLIEKEEDGTLKKLTPLVAGKYVELTNLLKKYIKQSKRCSFELKQKNKSTHANLESTTKSSISPKSAKRNSQITQIKE